MAIPPGANGGVPPHIPQNQPAQAQPVAPIQFPGIALPQNPEPLANRGVVLLNAPPIAPILLLPPIQEAEYGDRSVVVASAPFWAHQIFPMFNKAIAELLNTESMIDEEEEDTIRSKLGEYNEDVLTHYPILALFYKVKEPNRFPSPRIEFLQELINAVAQTDTDQMTRYIAERIKNVDHTAITNQLRTREQTREVAVEIAKYTNLHYVYNELSKIWNRLDRDQRNGFTEIPTRYFNEIGALRRRIEQLKNTPNEQITGNDVFEAIQSSLQYSSHEGLPFLLTEPLIQKIEPAGRIRLIPLFASRNLMNTTRALLLSLAPEDRTAPYLQAYLQLAATQFPNNPNSQTVIYPTRNFNALHQILQDGVLPNIRPSHFEILGQYLIEYECTSALPIFLASNCANLISDNAWIHWIKQTLRKQSVVTLNTLLRSRFANRPIPRETLASIIADICTQLVNPRNQHEDEADVLSVMFREYGNSIDISAVINELGARGQIIELSAFISHPVLRQLTTTEQLVLSLEKIISANQNIIFDHIFELATPHLQGMDLRRLMLHYVRYSPISDDPVSIWNTRQILTSILRSANGRLNDETWNEIIDAASASDRSNIDHLIDLYPREFMTPARINQIFRFLIEHQRYPQIFRMLRLPITDQITPESIQFAIAHASQQEVMNDGFAEFVFVQISVIPAFSPNRDGIAFINLLCRHSWIVHLSNFLLFNGNFIDIDLAINELIDQNYTDGLAAFVLCPTIDQRLTVGQRILSLEKFIEENCEAPFRAAMQAAQPFLEGEELRYLLLQFARTSPLMEDDEDFHLSSNILATIIAAGDRELNVATWEEAIQIGLASNDSNLSLLIDFCPVRLMPSRRVNEIFRFLAQQRRYLQLAKFFYMAKAQQITVESLNTLIDAASRQEGLDRSAFDVFSSIYDSPSFRPLVHTVPLLNLYNRNRWTAQVRNLLTSQSVKTAYFDDFNDTKRFLKTIPLKEFSGPTLGELLIRLVLSHCSSQFYQMVLSQPHAGEIPLSVIKYLLELASTEDTPSVTLARMLLRLRRANELDPDDLLYELERFAPHRSSKDYARELFIALLANDLSPQTLSKIYFIALKNNFLGEAATIQEKLGQSVEQLSSQPFFDILIKLAKAGNLPSLQQFYRFYRPRINREILLNALADANASGNFLTAKFLDECLQTDFPVRQ